MNLKKEPANVLKFWEIKHEIVNRLLAKVDLSKLSDLQPDILRHELHMVVDRICEALNQTFDPVTKDVLAHEVLNELLRRRTRKENDQPG
jgi:hypothetical protein